MTPAQQLDGLINGFRIAPLLHAAAQLRIADRLAGGPRSAEALAEEAGADADALARVLSALAAQGIFAQQDDDRFALTPLAEPLRRDHEDSRWATAMMWGESGNWRSYGAVMHSVRTGLPSFDHVHGQGVFEYYEQTPEAAEIFNEYMRERGDRDLRAIAAALPLDGVETVVDIGGGKGHLLAEILRQHPALQGGLFDQASVLPAADAHLRACGVRGRCALMAGSFFDDGDPLPTIGESWLLKWIIHDWDDARAIHILRRCADRLRAQPGRRLWLVEQVLSPDNPESYRTDVAMLLITGGRERTAAAYRALLGAAGLEMGRMLPTGCSFQLIEALPA